MLHFSGKRVYYLVIVNNETAPCIPTGGDLLPLGS